MQGIETIGMKAVQYNYSIGKINFETLSIALRIGYMLMDKTLLAGDNNNCLYPARLFNSATASQKISTLEGVYNNDGIHKQYLINIQNIKGNINDFKAIKHPDKTLIVLYKKMMLQLENMYTNYTDWLLKQNKCFGLMELAGIDDDNIFNFEFVIKDNSAPEKSVYPKSKINKFAKSLMPEKDKEGILITADYEFVNTSFLKDRKIYNFLDEESRDEKTIYLYRFLKFPIPINLTVAELNSVKKQLLTVTATLNETLSKWNNCFIEQDSIETRINFFEGNIIPFSNLLQQEIDNNAILKCLIQNETSDDPYIEIWIGEAPLPTIWEFYLYKRMIDEYEYEQLLIDAEQNPLLKKRVPVMIIVSENNRDNKEEEIETVYELDIMPSRKSILINE